MILCDRRTAELLISDSLSIEETNQFEEHLANCPKCQEMLVEVAGGSKAIDTASAMLSSSIEMPLWHDGPTALLSWSSGEQAQSSQSVDLSVLGPTDDPASMGRIGNYEIQGIIGRGGMGIVFRAIDSALSRNVAIKVLDPALASVAAARKRFALEARAMAAMREPKPSSATAARIASLFAKCRDGAACETPAMRAAARNVNAAVPSVSTMCSAASSSARGRSPWWYRLRRRGRCVRRRAFGGSFRSSCRIVVDYLSVDIVNMPC